MSPALARQLQIIRLKPSDLLQYHCNTTIDTSIWNNLNLVNIASSTSTSAVLATVGGHMRELLNDDKNFSNSQTGMIIRHLETVLLGTLLRG
jgi:hypothetical protein